MMLIMTMHMRYVAERCTKICFKRISSILSYTEQGIQLDDTDNCKGAFQYPLGNLC